MGQSSERSKGSCFSYAPTSRPFRHLRKRVAFNGALCRALGACAAASYALPAASCWLGEAFRAWVRAWRARLALIRAQNKAQLPPSRHSAALRCGQYSAKVGMLGSAIPLPHPFFMMRKGPEEVSDLLGARALHIHLHPHAHFRARQDARHMRGTSSRPARMAPVRTPS